MIKEILPMSKSEAQQLDFLIHALNTTYKDKAERMLESDGGFAISSVTNFDNDTIVIEVKYGIQIDNPRTTFTDIVKVDRKTMRVIEKIGVE